MVGSIIAFAFPGLPLAAPEVVERIPASPVAGPMLAVVYIQVDSESARYG